MSSGPEHYERAEQLLNGADQWDETDYDQRYYVKAAYAAAQIHATLALAAATALGLEPVPVEDDAWQKVCGVKPSADGEVPDAPEGDEADDRSFSVAPIANSEAAALWGDVHAAEHVVVYFKDGGYLVGQVRHLGDELVVAAGGDTVFTVVPADVARVETYTPETDYRGREQRRLKILDGLLAEARRRARLVGRTVACLRYRHSGQEDGCTDDGTNCLCDCHDGPRPSSEEAAADG